MNARRVLQREKTKLTHEPGNEKPNSPVTQLPEQRRAKKNVRPVPRIPRLVQQIWTRRQRLWKSSRTRHMSYAGPHSPSSRAGVFVVQAPAEDDAAGADELEDELDLEDEDEDLEDDELAGELEADDELADELDEEAEVPALAEADADAEEEDEEDEDEEDLEDDELAGELEADDELADELDEEDEVPVHPDWQPLEAKQKFGSITGGIGPVRGHESSALGNVRLAEADADAEEEEEDEEDDLEELDELEELNDDDDDDDDVPVHPDWQPLEAKQKFGSITQRISPEEDEDEDLEELNELDELKEEEDDDELVQPL
ncbi:hypothetical protein MMC10_007072 [Thelotrema lepadinum]|nr:hypothetical protein [Thelotrema lepadinum]